MKDIWIAQFLLAAPSVRGICFHFTSVQIPFRQHFPAIGMHSLQLILEFFSTGKLPFFAMSCACVPASEWVEWARGNDTHIESHSKRIFAPSKALSLNKWKVCQLKYIRAVKSQRRKQEQKIVSLAHSPELCSRKMAFTLHKKASRAAPPVAHTQAILLLNQLMCFERHTLMPELEVILGKKSITIALCLNWVYYLTVSKHFLATNKPLPKVYMDLTFAPI
jgi:hypothetical protein